jgi:glycosyltransferase involved in cell wall biosynthesis
VGVAARASGGVRRVTGPAVGYVVSVFPCWSETFIVREIHALRARGIPITIFSLTPPRERLVQAEAEPLLAAVVYPHPVRALRALLRHPVASLRAAWQAGREAAPRGVREIGKALYTVIAAADFAATARRRGIRHVHAHFATYPGLAARTMHRLCAVPYSVTAHAHDIFLPNPYLAENVRAARTLVTISDYNVRHLWSLGVHAAHAAVVPCGLDVQAFRPIAPEMRSAGAVVAIGRLVPIKGFSTLIAACAHLRARGVTFTCELIGGGPLHAELERQVLAHGLRDCVRLVGALDQQEVQRRLARAVVCVAPCVRAPDGDQDGVPTVVMEAMALEVPVVTTRVSGIPELVTDGVSGLLVEPGDAAALADAMETLLGDPRLRRRLATAGREAVRRRQDMPRAAARMDRIFREAIGGR